MPQPTDLFCHTILNFAELNTLVSFNPLPCKYLERTYPHMIYQWSAGIVSPLPNVWGDLFLKKKVFMTDGGAPFWEQIYGGWVVLHG